jgi:hypothetical protein
MIKFFFKVLYCLIVVTTLVTSCSNEKSTDDNSNNHSEFNDSTTSQEIFFQKNNVKFYYDSINIKKCIVKQQDSFCIEIFFKYPIFTSQTKDYTFWNEKVKKIFLPDSFQNKNIQDYADYLVKDYFNFINENEEDKEMLSFEQNYEYEKVVSVKNFLDNFLTFELIDYWYTGGAHPNFYSKYFNYISKKEIKFNDLFSDTFALKKKLIKSLRKLFELNDKQTLEEQGFFIDKNNLPLNDNYYFENDTMYVVYNPYEIASYVVGEITLKVPLFELSSIIKPEFKFLINQKN